MLLFVDELRHIRVVRQADAGGGREPIGRIRKHESTIPDEVLGALKPDEAAEVEAALARLAQGEKDRLMAEIARLPASLSAIGDFYRHDASDLERRWIRGAVQETMRIIRGHDRTLADAPNA